MEQMDEIKAHVAYDKTIILELDIEEFNYIKHCVEKWTNQRARSRINQSSQRGSKLTRPRYNEKIIGFPQALLSDKIFYAHGPPVEDEEEEKITISPTRTNKLVARPSIPSPSSVMPRRTPPKPKLSPKRKISPRGNPFVKDDE